MSKLVSFRDFFKTTGLVLAALVFLGSMEFSASSGAGDGKTSVRATNLSQLPTFSDNILGETEEEREVDARAAAYLLTEFVFLPESIPDRGYLLPDKVEIYRSFQRFPSHLRGPPAI